MNDTSVLFARKHPENAEAEAASRELARRGLIHFATYTHDKYIPEAFHIDVAEHLEEAMRGGVRRLILVAPPQHGKSELVSVRFPAFWLAKRPNDPVILCSYGAQLAQAKATGVKEIMADTSYRLLFPDQFELKGRTIPYWSRKPYIGKVTWAGVGGPITGFGGALGIIDDPVKNFEEAESLGQRDKVWTWWQSVFRTRIWENGIIVIIMTRWHEDDLVGRIMESSSEKWQVLRYPAIAESQEERDFINARFYHQPPGQPDPLHRKPGDPLCPQRYSLAELQSLKHDVGNRAWATEYMGAPISVKGNRIQRAWLHIVDDSPRKMMRRVRYWDKAGTKNAGAYTCGLLMGITVDKLIYIENVVRGQWSALERERIIKETAIMDRDIYNNVDVFVEQEPGSGGLESAENTIRNMAGISVRADRPRQDKDIRFEPFAVYCEAGNVFIKNGKWTQEYIDEITAVPGSHYRDQADATSGAFKQLTENLLRQQRTYHGTVER